MAKKYDHDEHLDQIKETFRKILQQLVAGSGKTATQIASESGVSKSQLAHWQKGPVFPDAANLIRLADYFRVSTDYLLGREDQHDGDQPYTTAGEAIDAIRRLHHSTESVVKVETVNAFDFYDQLYPTTGNYYDPDEEISIVTIQIPHSAIVEYMIKARRIHELFRGQKDMEEERNDLLQKYKAKADAVRLQTDEKGE